MADTITVASLRHKQRHTLSDVGLGKLDDTPGRCFLRKPSQLRRASELCEIGLLTDLGPRTEGRFEGQVFEVTDLGRELLKDIKPRRR